MSVRPLHDEHPLKADKQTLAEIVIIAGSGVEGRTLQQANFIQKHAISVVALHRAGKAMEMGRSGIGKTRLQIGDVLLVQGETEQLRLLKAKPGLLIIDGAESLPQTSKAPIALAINPIVYSYLHI